MVEEDTRIMTRPRMAGDAVRLVYFAWVRERIGMAEESVDAARRTSRRSPTHALAEGARRGLRARLRERPLVRAALDQIHVKQDARIAGASEIAFFPPMTGG